MARYEHLPFYKAAMDLTVYIEQVGLFQFKHIAYVLLVTGIVGAKEAQS